MKITPLSLLVGLLLSACGKSSSDAPAPAGTSLSAPASPAPSAARPVGTASASTVASAASSKPSDAPTAASAAPSASAAAASPCPDGARKDDKARYCITLPAKFLAISYTSEKDGSEEVVEDTATHSEITITITSIPPGSTVASLRKTLLDSSEGKTLVESGDLPRGFWTDMKKKDGGHTVSGVVMGKSLIACTVSVRDEAGVEAARAVCKSLKTF